MCSQKQYLFSCCYKEINVNLLFLCNRHINNLLVICVIFKMRWSSFTVIVMKRAARIFNYNDICFPGTKVMQVPKNMSFGAKYYFNY